MHRGLSERFVLHFEFQELLRARPAHREPHFLARLAFEQLHRLRHTDGVRQHVVDAHQLIA